MLSTNRRLAIPLAAVASVFTTTHAAPAPPTEDDLETKDANNDQQKDLINDLADEWASDDGDKSGDETLPLDDQQDVSALSVDATEHDEILDTEGGEQVDVELFISEESSSNASELDPETQELEDIAENTDNEVHIQVEQANQGDGQELDIDIADTTGIEYDVSQESFDEAAIETESEANDIEDTISSEQIHQLEDVPEIKVDGEEEVTEIIWDTEPDSDIADAVDDESTLENDELIEDEQSSTDLAQVNDDEITSHQDPLEENNQPEEDIQLDDALTEEINAEESNEEVDFGEGALTEELEGPILDVNLSPSEELQESELEADFAEYTSSEESETDVVYTATVDEDNAADMADFFVDETTAAADEPGIDIDTQGEIDSLLDSIQQSMGEPIPISDDNRGAIKPTDGLLGEAQIPDEANTPFNNAKGADPFNPANQHSIDSLEDENSGISLNLLLFLAIIVFLIFKSPKIKRYIFARESGSLPYHAIGRKNRD